MRYLIALIVALLVADAALLEGIVTAEEGEPQEVAVLEVSDKELEGVFTFNDRTVVVIPDRSGDAGN